MPNPKIFCNVPWFHMQLYHDGSYGLCCSERAPVFDGYAKQPEHTKPNIKTTSIREWYRSEKMKKYRQQMLGDRPLPECAGCYQDEQYGNDSYRKTNNWRSVIFTHQNFQESFEQSPHYDIFVSEQSGQALDDHYDGMPVDLHIDMGNECNLYCKHCNPSYSTQIAAKYKTWGILSREDYHTRMNWMDDEEVWQRFLNELLSMKNLRSVHFMGGEPTMSPRLDDFLDFFIKHGRTDFAMSMVTNGTRYSEELAEKFARFFRADIDISIESVSDNNFYIRQGLDKELFWNNINKFLSHQSETFCICLKPTINVLTVPTFPELIEWMFDNNVVTENNVCWNPTYLQAAVLPLELRQSYFPEYERVLSKLSNAVNHSQHTDMSQSREHGKNSINLYNELNSVYNMIKAPEMPNAEELKIELVKWMNKWDHHCNLDARDYYPEWTDFLEQYEYKKISHSH